MRKPVHIGKFIADELEELDLTPEQLAKRLLVEVSDITNLLEEKSDLSADMALRLGQFFSTGHETWMNLQDIYEIDLARQEMGDQLGAIAPMQSKEFSEAHP